MRTSRRLPRRMTAIGDWPLWSLPRWLMAYLLAIIAIDMAALGIAASFTSLTRHDLTLFGLLLGCTAVAIELTKKSGEQDGVIKDVQGVWQLPAAILLPPLYALIIPIVRTALVQGRIRKGLLHRRVFSGAAISLSYGAASLIFHSLSGLMPQGSGGLLSRGTVWTLLVVLSVLVKEVLNKAAIITAAKAADPATHIRTELFAREPLYNDAAEICTGLFIRVIFPTDARACRIFGDSFPAQVNTIRG